MAWTDGIKEVAVGVMDYGPEFSAYFRYEYIVLLIKDDGVMEDIPGTFTNRAECRARAIEIQGMVGKANGSCNLNKDMKLDSKNMHGKQLELVERRKLAWREKMKSSLERKQAASHNINAPGGAYDHSQR